MPSQSSSPTRRASTEPRGLLRGVCAVRPRSARRRRGRGRRRVRQGQVVPEFARELDEGLVHYTGRPSVFTEAPVRGYVRGARVFLKREDLNHTGSHKINNVLGQALLTRRMGKTRVIAETGAGQHGVATATACPAWDCTIYMGEVDTRRQALQCRPDADARRRGRRREVRQPHPEGRHQRGVPRLGTSTTPTTCSVPVAGPHPFPRGHGRDFHRNDLGVEARRQVWQQAGRLPDAAIACVGGGSNAIGLFHAFIPRVRLAHRAANRPGTAFSMAEHAATSSAGRTRHPARLPLLRPPGRRGPDHQPTPSRPACTTRASARALLPQGLRPRRVPRGHRRRRDGGAAPAVAHRGHHPGHQPAHALAGALEVGRELGEDGLIVVNLSGRGDKDMDTAARYFGLYDTDAEVAENASGSAEIEGHAERAGTYGCWTTPSPPPRPRAAPPSSPTSRPASRPSTSASRPSRPPWTAAPTSSRSACRTATPRWAARSSRPPTTSPCAAA
ncbi:Tryptophan synthase beta chain [Streptomyces fumanus]